MPGKTPQTSIIDLTEIVEPGAPSASHRAEEELSGHVSDLMKSGDAGDDIELDDLLAQLNDGPEDAAPAARVVNPNESLTMPGMDDMDAMLGQFGSPEPAKAPAQASGTDPDLDDLLAELENDTPPQKAAPAPSGEVDLDDLLADLDTPPQKASSAQDSPFAEEDLDSLLSELDTQAAPAPSAPDEDDLDLDALLDSRDAAPETRADSTPAPAADNGDNDDSGDLDALLDDLVPAAAAPADSKHDELLNNLLDGLDVPPSGPMVRAPNLLDMSAVPKAAAPDVDSLDTLLSGVAGNAVPAADPSRILELRQDLDTLREQAEHTADNLHTLRDEHAQLRESVDALHESAGESGAEAVADFAARLESVEELCGALSGELTATQQRLAAFADQLAALGVAPSLTLEQVDNSVEQAVSAVRAEVAGLVMPVSGELEAVQERLAAVDAIQDRLAAVDAIQDRLAAVDAIQDRLAAIDAIQERLAAIDAIQDRLAVLDAVQERLAAVESAPSLHSNLSPGLSEEQLNGVVAHVLSAMQAEIEKAAAASAAKVIREEISALFSDARQVS